MVVYKGPSFSSVQQAAAVAPTLGQEQQDDVGIVEQANALVTWSHAPVFL